MILVQHRKRGTVYEIITKTAKLQCSSLQAAEDHFAGDDFVIYRDIETRTHYYVRPRAEFFDGRFEVLLDAHASPP